MEYQKPEIKISRKQLYDKKSGTPKSYRIITSKNRNPYHYVTHDPGFKYDEYGIHIGQMDRLSFFSESPGKLVQVHLVDCRYGSPDLHCKYIINVPTDGSQILEIPPGYAHWLTNLDNVTTRNDYSLFVPQGSNEQWNVMNDDITVKLSEAEYKMPIVNVNKKPLPSEAEFLVSKMLSKSFTGGASRISTETSINIKGNETELIITSDNKKELNIPITNIEVANFIPGSYQQTRKDSLTVVSNVQSGLSQTMRVSESPEWPEYYTSNPFMTFYLTPLTSAPGTVSVEILDRLVGSPTFGQSEIVELVLDARITLELRPGAVWRMKNNNKFHYRLEYTIHEKFSKHIKLPFQYIPANEVQDYITFPVGNPVSPSFERSLAYDE